MGTPLRVFWSDRLEELADRLFAAWEGRAPARPDSATRDGKPLRDPFSRICVVVGDLSTRNWMQRHFLLHRKPGTRRILANIDFKPLAEFVREELGYKTLDEGQAVEFEITTGQNGKLQASSVRKI